MRRMDATKTKTTGIRFTMKQRREVQKLFVSIELRTADLLPKSGKFKLCLYND
jgi:hypothetical protein